MPDAHSAEGQNPPAPVGCEGRARPDPPNPSCPCCSASGGEVEALLMSSLTSISAWDGFRCSRLRAGIFLLLQGGVALTRATMLCWALSLGLQLCHLLSALHVQTPPFTTLLPSPKKHHRLPTPPRALPPRHREDCTAKSRG